MLYSKNHIGRRVIHVQADTDPGDAAAGLALASWRLILNHPVIGKKLDLRGIPEDGAFAEYRRILAGFER